MTLKEIKHIVEIAGTYDLDFPDDMDEFLETAYNPVREAVANNDKTVIDYIGNCNEKGQFILYTAVVDGAADGQHPDAIKLYEKIRKENGFKIDSRIKI